MRQDVINFINSEILNKARSLSYLVKDVAPNTEQELLSTPSLVIWSGGSENTVYGDEKVNFAFRALHDDLHLKTRLGFSHEEEIELGRIQASKFSSTLMQEVIFCEVALQAKYHKETGLFLDDQKSFTETHLKSLRLI